MLPVPKVGGVAPISGQHTLAVALVLAILSIFLSFQSHAAAPAIGAPPQSQTVSAGATVILSVSVTNTATLPIGYRWRSNNIYLADGFFTLNRRTAFFTITNARPPFTN